MKTVKKISFTTIILISIITLVSCSSGSSTGNGALNLTGRWDGSVTVPGGFAQATMTISQDQEVTLAGTSDFDAVMVIPSEGCTLAIENGTVNGRTNSVSTGVGEFTWVAVADSNSQITGDLTAISDDVSNNGDTTVIDTDGDGIPDTVVPDGGSSVSACQVLGPFRFNRI